MNKKEQTKMKERPNKWIKILPNGSLEWKNAKKTDK